MFTPLEILGFHVILPFCHVQYLECDPVCCPGSKVFANTNNKREYKGKTHKLSTLFATISFVLWIKRTRWKSIPVVKSYPSIGIRGLETSQVLWHHFWRFVLHFKTFSFSAHAPCSIEGDLYASSFKCSSAGGQDLPCCQSDGCLFFLFFSVCR